ncbi:hypothetical protein ZIOFF_042152 [Zingiber officinale]|uniref:NB-ARC domain-containing protein n=1 Tax=Zingiber officinale TaxID=94328 RepID=A0A8J5G818_ZINOF|nr:hypothetical protein ZIOFF_042152 [Zingiber officinale]
MATINFGKFLNRIYDIALFHLARPRSGVEDLQRDAELLRAKLEDIDRAIDEAVRNGQIVSVETQLWKRQAEAFISEEVAAIQRDYRAMVCFRGLSWNCISINQRVKKMKEMSALINQVDSSRIATQLPQPLLPWRDENAWVIGIYVMGEIGKTTLLKLINNHRWISEFKFDYVVWIVAYKGHKLQKIQKDLAKKVGLNLEDDTPILWSHGMADRTVLFEAGQAGPPFLVQAGMSCEFKSHDMADRTVLFEAGQAGPPFLEQASMSCEFKAYPNVGHSITTEELLHLQSWIKALV